MVHRYSLFRIYYSKGEISVRSILEAICRISAHARMLLSQLKNSPEAVSFSITKERPEGRFPVSTTKERPESRSPLVSIKAGLNGSAPIDVLFTDPLP